MRERILIWKQKYFLILKTFQVRDWNGLIWLTLLLPIVDTADIFENESVKGGEFLDYVISLQLEKNCFHEVYYLIITVILRPFFESHLRELCTSKNFFLTVRNSLCSKNCPKEQLILFQF